MFLDYVLYSEDGFRTRRMTNFCKLFGSLKESFIRSEIIHVPRTQNTKADNLARSVRTQTSFVVHMDQHLPAWFTESI
ncbi:hypothetical protein Bca101_006801 [Brassica carinata]